MHCRLTIVTATIRRPDHQAFGAFFKEARGKDKFARALSYYGRLRAYTARDTAPHVAVFWEQVSGDLSMHRKTFKLFKWVADYNKVNMSTCPHVLIEHPFY